MFLVRLDLQFFAGEKTEKATPKKRQDSRKKGQVAKSQDVTTAIMLLLVFLYFIFGARHTLEKMMLIIKESFQTYMLTEVTEESVFILLRDLLPEIAYALGPIMLVALVGALAANYMQVGVLFSAEPLQPKLEKVDPIKGAKRIFSMRAIVELLKSTLKIVLIGAVTFAVLWINIDEVLILSHRSIGDSLVSLAKLVLQMGLAASCVLLLLSVLDYMYQKFDFEKNIRMSKQDIKEENKNVEGDPLIKSKIKQKQREMAMSRMMQEVPKADVVITNPTHYAIALKYDEDKMDAPYVVASGVDFVAQKIKAVAKSHEIIMVENRPLARGLYEQTKVGDVVPEEFFKAVAEILAYVYRIQKKV
ncbi:flagellar biosynthesis protein FlhB [Priestia flexa]|jgi:flagellar biosynthesis protein FlhB|uniref:Flagellar biosynthetic protein FlhB n=2 Tax=Priestia TaxID=2800373 RepID=A0A0V8JRL2_9BACI|nr:MULTISPECIES: flagellar biosynthesis protein FlhB [Bacillaceae]AQX54062.1 flagellar biosynthesis protein FlhB [Priestia flexa]KSU89653.1 flagellar biosynthetic protein FlhB [Priestia veravalensis]KZB93255.1 flagellar biosynthesis protein FlhB [Bacillus sp. VT 712]MBN8250070.1 flagellar biosynthesis protein FlhB [Priestia flexa]MBN8434607.1 flagellar biosynthesis protein FlhB [Priestia flexa]